MVSKSVAVDISGIDASVAAGAVKVGILPVCVDRHQAPSIGAGRGANALPLSAGTLRAAGAAIVKHAVERVTARPRVGVGAELIR